MSHPPAWNPLTDWKQHSRPRLFKLNAICRKKYGSWQYWRDNFDRFKGF